MASISTDLRNFLRVEPIIKGRFVVRGMDITFVSGPCPEHIEPRGHRTARGKGLFPGSDIAFFN